jgi:serine/threonine-protein kinase
VYLLGAVLFEIVAGQPPRTGGDLVQLVKEITGGPPPLPASAPPELAALVTDAMAVDPDERVVDVATFRARLSRYLAQRGASRVLDAAAPAVDALEASARGDEPLDRALQAFATVRFATEQARALSPDDVGAAGVFARALALAVESALRTDAVETAASLISGEVAVPPEVRARVEREVERRKDERRRVAAALREHDPRAGMRMRRYTGLVVACAAIAVTLFEAGLNVVSGMPRPPLVSALVLPFLTVGFVAAHAVLRRMTTLTLLNRRFLHMGILIGAVGSTMRLVEYRYGIDEVAADHIVSAALAAGVVGVALTVDGRFVRAAIAHVIAVAVGLVWPDVRLFAMAIAWAVVGADAWRSGESDVGARFGVRPRRRRRETST